MTAAPPYKTLDIAPILDDGRWTGYQKTVLFLVALVAMLDGVDAQVLSLSLPSIIGDWGVMRADFAPYLAVGFVAMALGTMAGGLAGDRIGRKRALIGSALIFGSMTLFGAFAHNLPMLGLTRILASVGLGAAMPNVTAILAEYTPLKRRSLSLSIGMSALPIGGIVVGLLAGQILPNGGWRALFAVAGVLPLLVAALLSFTLPESLRFLAAQGGDTRRAQSILRRMGIPVEAGTVLVDTGEQAAVRKASLKDVLSRNYWRDSLLLSIAFFAVILSTYVVFTWSPSLFADAGFDLTTASTSMSVFSLGGLLGGVGGAWLFSRFGSRGPLTLMAFGAAVVTGALVFAPMGTGGHTIALLFGGLFLAGVFIPGTQAALFALAAQVYPTRFRATGVGLVASLGRLGAVMSAFVGPGLLAVGSTAFFGFLAGAMTVVAVALLMINRHVRRLP
ncbi:aromatic acid/H+ symport family MFS transporter [soil metagenome]